jgi:hypothetical protein
MKLSKGFMIRTTVILSALIIARGAGVSVTIAAPIAIVLLLGTLAADWYLSRVA